MTDTSLFKQLVAAYWTNAALSATLTAVGLGAAWLFGRRYLARLGLTFADVVAKVMGVPARSVVTTPATSYAPPSMDTRAWPACAHCALACLEGAHATPREAEADVDAAASAAES